MISRFFMHAALTLQVSAGGIFMLMLAGLHQGSRVETFPQLLALCWCCNIVAPFLVIVLYYTEDRQDALARVPSNRPIVLIICTTMIAMQVSLFISIQTNAHDANHLRSLMSIYMAAPPIIATGLMWRLKQEYFWN